jgi:hypothetical protein
MYCQSAIQVINCSDHSSLALSLSLSCSLYREPAIMAVDVTAAKGKEKAELNVCERMINGRV